MVTSARWDALPPGRGYNGYAGRCAMIGMNCVGACLRVCSRQNGGFRCDLRRGGTYHHLKLLDFFSGERLLRENVGNRGLLGCGG